MGLRRAPRSSWTALRRGDPPRAKALVLRRHEGPTTHNRPVEEWARTAARFALGQIVGDWPRFPPDSLRLAKDVLPVVAMEQQRRGLEVIDLDEAATVLDEALIKNLLTA